MMELLCMHKLCTATANNTSTTAKMDLILLDQYRITNVLLQGWLKQNKNKTLVVITDNVASLRKLLLTTITRVGERKNPHITALSNMAQINHAD